MHKEFRSRNSSPKFPRPHSEMRKLLLATDKFENGFRQRHSIDSPSRRDVIEHFTTRLNEATEKNLSFAALGNITAELIKKLTTIVDENAKLRMKAESLEKLVYAIDADRHEIEKLLSELSQPAKRSLKRCN